MLLGTGRPLIGVAPYWTLGSLKHHLLVCEQIDLINITAAVDAAYAWFGEPIVADLQFLIERGVIVAASLDSLAGRGPSEQLLPLLQELTARMAEADAEAQHGLSQHPAITGDGNADCGPAFAMVQRAIEQKTVLEARFKSALMRTCGINAVAIGEGELFRGTPPEREETILQVVLEGIPVPDDSVPLEAVLEFRSDDRVRLFYHNLRTWMTRAAAGEVSSKQLAGEIESAVGNFRSYVANHRVQIRMSAWSSFWKSAATGSVLGVQVDGALGAVAAVGGVVATLRRTVAALHNAELTAPGAELAFISKAREEFGQ